VSCSFQISVIVAASSTVRSQSVVRSRGVPASSAGWPKWRTKTTSGGRKIALGSGSGGRGIRDTGAKRSLRPTRGYKRAAVHKFLQIRRLRLQHRPMRYKNSASCNPRCLWTYLHDERLCVTRRHRPHRPKFHSSWPGHPGHEPRSRIRLEL
jgi:hypothetical protein